MKKKMFITSIMLVAAIGLGACGSSSSSATDTYTQAQDNYSETADTGNYADTENGTDGQVYYEIDDREKQSVLTDANEYESGNASDSDEYVYAAVNENLMNAFGTTYSVLSNTCNTVYPMDAMPSYYGFEDETHNGNEIYLMQQLGAERMGENDVCVGAYGWLTRVFEFEHDWRKTIEDFTNALRATYPDCTSLQYTDKSVIPSAPSNISDTLAYVEFTVPFPMTGNTKVRLYIEAGSYGETGASADTWVYLQAI